MATWLLSILMSTSMEKSLLLTESRNFSQPHSQNAKIFGENEFLSTL